MPRLSVASVCRFRSRRIQKRLASLRKTLGLANAAIDALNELHGTRTCRTVAGPADVKSPRVAEILQYIMECSQQYVDAAVSAARGVSDMKDMGNTWNYEGKGAEPVESLIAERLSLPKRGGTFDAAAYLAPHLAACLSGDPAT